MRLPHIHFTVRRLMVVVALVATSIWVLQTGWRWRVYRSQAVYHATVGQWLLDSATDAELNAAQARRELPGLLNEARGFGAGQLFIDEREVAFAEFAAFHEQILANMAASAAHERARATYHAQLKRKYLRAAARPWRAVAPDPPSP